MKYVILAYGSQRDYDGMAGKATSDSPMVALNHAVRAHLLELAGDHAAARTAYEVAAGRAMNVPQQRYPCARAAALAQGRPDL